MYVAPDMPLTQWPIGDASILKKYIYICVYILNFDTRVDIVLMSLLHAITNDKVNIGSGNGLLPSGNELLPGPMLTQFYVAI